MTHVKSTFHMSILRLDLMACMFYILTWIKTSFPTHLSDIRERQKRGRNFSKLYWERGCLSNCDCWKACLYSILLSNAWKRVHFWELLRSKTHPQVGNFLGNLDITEGSLSKHLTTFGEALLKSCTKQVNKIFKKPHRLTVKAQIEKLHMV